MQQVLKEMEEQDEFKAAQEYYGEKAYQEWMQVTMLAVKVRQGKQDNLPSLYSWPQFIEPWLTKLLLINHGSPVLWRELLLALFLQIIYYWVSESGEMIENWGNDVC